MAAAGNAGHYLRDFEDGMEPTVCTSSWPHPCAHACAYTAAGLMQRTARGLAACKCVARRSSAAGCRALRDTVVSMCAPRVDHVLAGLGVSARVVWRGAARWQVGARPSEWRRGSFESYKHYAVPDYPNGALAWAPEDQSGRSLALRLAPAPAPAWFGGPAFAARHTT